MNTAFTDLPKTEGFDYPLVVFNSIYRAADLGH